MKNSTPMKKLSNLFTVLNTVLIDTNVCRKTELTKHNYSYKIGYEKKGVDSDFIRIYKFNTDLDLSFAFAFNYENGLDEINVTIKETDEIISMMFNFESFKPKFKQFIQSLNTLKYINLLLKENIISLVKKTFVFKEPLKSEVEIIEELNTKFNEKFKNR